MASLISRRRTIMITAAACGLPLLGWPAASRESPAPTVWRGQALGATATLVLNHPDQQAGQRLVRDVVAEVNRLEDIFSLYRENSLLSELNRVGALAMPPEELVAVLERSRSVWEETSGLFDPTVQPLWSLYSRHFARSDADPAGPSESEIGEARKLVGLENVHFSRGRIAFARRGMALTFNGIAQGYVTDRVVARLREAGITSSLVDMGETRAIGRRPDGQPWQVGLAETQSGADPSDAVLPLVDKAIATSSHSGFRFDPQGRFGHILDPRRGAIAPHYRRLTTVAADATRADAYSTAMSLMSLDQLRTTAARLADVTLDLVTVAGERVRLG